MTRELNFPSFNGFYESIWSACIEDSETYWLQDCKDRGMIHTECCKDYFFDMKKVYNQIASDYSDFIIDEYNRTLGLDLKCVGEPSVSSPNYYNYTTDKIYRDVENIDTDKIIALMETHKDQLSDIIYENHQSYDGFISFMDNTFGEWVEHIKENDNLYLSYALLYLYVIKTNTKSANDIDILAYDYVYPEIEWIADSEEAKAEIAKVNLIEDLWGFGTYNSETMENMSVEEVEEFCKNQKMLYKDQLSFEF